ncbi:hypothetical protein ACN42_g6413 [Penicillium freii]|uniref:Transcription factor domain-containing protein n=1 Tax=Penicillium freii TaxID=48697 RepID=A0A117NNE9_PENFR|nr:hypothetical protein ACN42_g6413 [Penicillium freii]
MGTPKLVNSTARAQSGEPDESNVLARDIEVTVPVEARPPICDGEIPLAHTETFSFSDLVGTEFNGSVLSEDLGFGFYNNDFDNLMDISENDVLMLSNSDGDAGDSSPGRTMDLVYHLEETGSRTKPSNLPLIGGTDTFTRYQPVTQSAQRSLQACWPTELAAQRTILNIVCFLGVMNVASLSSSIFLPPSFDIGFPYSETLFLSDKEEDWECLFSSAPRPQTFKVALHNLTSLSGPVLQIDSGLGNLVLIIALYAHVRSCKAVSASLPITFGREIIETSTVSLKRWLNSLAGSGVAGQHEQIGADCSLTASALILWKVATIQLYADFASVAEVQDAILALSTGQQTIYALQPIRMPTHTGEAMGHAVSFVRAPVIRGIQFLKATACADISIYHPLMEFHCIILLVRWLSSLESVSKATGSQCTHPDELMSLQNIRELISESDQPSIEGVPLSVACARIWVEILESDRQI